MITVEEALHIVLEHKKDFGVETIPLHDAYGRILREPIKADRDFPPYDRVTMDGIAIRYDAFEKGNRKFPVEGVAPAGAMQASLNHPEKCLEVMTGAVMPEIADTVIRYEDVEITDGIASIQVDDLQYRQNIHFQGEDRKKGDVVIEPGIRISSSEIGVCATVGKTHVKVSKLPRTIIISTGDELVDIGDNPLPHQIRRSNVYRLSTVLKHNHIPVTTAHLPDDRDSIDKALKEYLEEFDLLILNGGVSKGKFDYLPEALEAAKVRKLFHKIRQRPGKPFWFGVHENATVFAFPGNPVSSFMCMQQYFIPWLSTSLMENDRKILKAVLLDDVQFKPDLTYFLEVMLSYSSEGRIEAAPVKGNGSGDLANLVDAEAFIILPRGKDIYKKGEVYPLLMYR
jgi:molybdopterin molybdotransferase